MSSLIKNDRKVTARHFHSTKRFIDDLCAVNDGGEFGKSFPDIYPQELELKVEHSGDRASFLNLDIHIQDGMFIYHLYDKRDDFPFFIVRMPHRDSNIPDSIFYSALVGEFLRIGRSTLLLQDFVPKANSLVERMLRQGAQEWAVKKHLKKIIFKHPDCFQKFQILPNELVSKVM